MDFTFGIITNLDGDEYLEKIIESIEVLKIPNYEILIVGETKLKHNKITIISFDETKKRNWITRKKNLSAQFANYENIVFLHNYVYFEETWYEEFLKFGNDFDVCMNQIINYDNTRFRDWLIWMHNDIEIDHILTENLELMIPYDSTHLTKYMFISGTYWVAKKDFSLKYPQDETLCWNQEEDVAWSKIVREHTTFKFNPKSIVRLLKYKKPVFNVATVETMNKINQTLNSSSI
jgi:hypothetical protein